jgi:hypothetical protein
VRGNLHSRSNRVRSQPHPHPQPHSLHTYLLLGWGREVGLGSGGTGTSRGGACGQQGAEAGGQGGGEGGQGRCILRTLSAWGLPGMAHAILQTRQQPLNRHYQSVSGSKPAAEISSAGGDYQHHSCLWGAEQLHLRIPTRGFQQSLPKDLWHLNLRSTLACRVTGSGESGGSSHYQSHLCHQHLDIALVEA